MTSYIEYGVNLTDNQKMNLATAINNKTPLTLRIKHINLRGNDELMLTKTQIGIIQKSLANGTGVNIKISKTQIRKVAKHGGNLFSSLASLGARALPYAVKGLSKAVPALANWCCFCTWDLWELIRFLLKELIFPKNSFQCYQGL